MIDIQQRLKTLFQEQRLIFWYDEDGALRDEFEKVSIADVTSLVIDNNEFAIKIEVLINSPLKKFLIYSPQKAPEDEENWLLDLNIANYIFAADKTSLILQNIGLDVHFKSYIQKYHKFFNSQKRLESFRQRLGDDESVDTLSIKMMACSLSCEENIEDILLKVFSDEKHFKKLEGFALEEPFFRFLQSRYAYEGDSIEDLLYKMMTNHFYAYHDRSKSPLNNEARLFVKKWMDSNRYKESFAKHSLEVAKKLNIDAVLTEIEPTKIISCDTYRSCDKVIIANLLQKLDEDRLSIKDVKEVVEKREHTFWYKEYANIYKALLNATSLFEFVKERTFEIESFKDGINAYVRDWYRGDSYYREYSLYASKAEHIELLKGLSKRVEDIYLNGFLRELNDCWQGFADGYKRDIITHHQQAFYQEFIAPMLSKNKRAFVIISDALRYECGVELTAKIKSMDKYSAECTHMVSSLPSYTQLGMASLLPHKELSIKDKNDIVFVDKKSSSGMENRAKILKTYDKNASAIGYEAFLKLSRDDGRAFTKSSSVIYIYHDEIDKMGEKNEIKTFDAVESTYETITKIVKQIINFNGVNIFITSDHGFLYTNEATKDSEFCKVDSKGSVKSNRRFIIGKNLKVNTCVSKYSGDILGIEGENEFLIAKSINKIRVQGGGNRFVHGGASLQELVIPLIHIRKDRVTDVRNVNVEIIPIKQISTNSVNLSLYQSEMIDEKIKPISLKVAFESRDGVVLSDVFKHTFDSTESYDTNREVKFRLSFKQEIKAYNNQIIKLVAREILENSSERPLYKSIDVKLALAFFNDFDDDF